MSKYPSVILPGPEDTQDKHVAGRLIVAGVRLKLIQNTMAPRQEFSCVWDGTAAPCAGIGRQSPDRQGDRLQLGARLATRTSLTIPAFYNRKIARGVVRKANPARQGRKAAADVGGGNSSAVPILSTHASIASSVTHSPRKAC